jgi:hypothetical protein
VISTDSLTVVAMVGALAVGTGVVFRRTARLPVDRARAGRRAGVGRVPPRCRVAATVAMAGLTGLFAAMWLAEFGSKPAAAAVAAVSAIVIAAGLVAIATTWIWWRPRRLLPASLRAEPDGPTAPDAQA